MHKKLYHFLEENNILFKKQFGFRKNNSTVYALIEITEKIKKSIDSGLYGCGIFIESRKAFDTVNHDIILMKLQHYGIRNNMLSWFKSYLSDRKQFVSFNGQNSETLKTNCGVPQGSVLGTLLFLLYINDLIDMEKTINKELSKLYLWLNVNRLSLNLDKTHFIIFHPYNKLLKKQITIKIKRQ